MADSQSTKDRREKIESDERYWATVHTGTRDMLIAAGLAKLEQFPGEPGCGKSSTVFRPKDGSRKFKVSRRSTYLYEVSIYKTPEERAKYEAEESAEIQANAAAYRAEQTRKDIAAPGGVRGMAEKWLEGGIVGVLQAFNAANDPNKPFSFDPRTVEEVTERCQSLITLFHSRKMTPRLGHIAQADPEFQRFMQATTKDGAKP